MVDVSFLHDVCLESVPGLHRLVAKVPEGVRLALGGDVLLDDDHLTLQPDGRLAQRLGRLLQRPEDNTQRVIMYGINKPKHRCRNVRFNQLNSPRNK
jgi:hypothetical protein